MTTAFQRQNSFASRMEPRGVDAFTTKIKAPSERGCSTTCAILIDDVDWQARHHKFITELQAKTKQFISLTLLMNVRKLIFMDLFFLRGRDVDKKHQSISQPL
jgi:hypothetical protein